MRENKLKAIWAEGGAALNGWLHLPSHYAAETMAHQGWDSLTIDMQHGPVGYEAALQLLTAISTTDTVPVARVPWNEPGIIMKMLDAGAAGIICPMVNTRAECEAFVQACRYPPVGYRSYGPNRAKLYGGADYADTAHQTVVTFAMIETAEAVENVDAILSVEGLDALYVGPADLSRSMGKTAVDYDAEPLTGAVDKIIASAQKHGIVLGGHTGSPEIALGLIERGFQFVTVGSDARLLAAGSQAIITAVKGGASDVDESGPY